MKKKIRLSQLMQEKYWQNLTPIYTKNNKLGVERNYLGIIKAICEKPMANIIFNDEKFKKNLYFYDQE